ncbi:acylneuraminate cytidylyltransferase family protein [archaeon]|jgi:CMP-N,N'-diacetyllegionaminic acid synthase|nr:acylneuraminate cytidylyltransferase family protein [archaeon]
MKRKENIVVIIPARGGSKGIPGKNLKLLQNKPLLAYPIEAALKVKDIDRVIVSTDDLEIAETAKKYGAEILFMRPSELSGDMVPTTPVLQHTIDWLREHEKFETDIVVLLYATSPLLASDKIQEGIKTIKNNLEVDSVVSGCIDDKYHWKIKKGNLKRFYPLELAPRQQMDPLFIENGALYIVRSKTMKETGRYIGGRIKHIFMDAKDSWDIDEESDFEIVEALMKKKKNKL